MEKSKSFHSICRWTFNAGKGGFVPADMRPQWNSKNLETVDVIRLIKEKITPKLPEWVELGLEIHYDFEFNEFNAAQIAAALKENEIRLAMVTPGAHAHFAYGGIASLDKEERAAAEAFSQKTVDLTYDILKKAWHPEPYLVPTFVIWNGSFGYDLASVGLQQMYNNLKESIASLCQYEAKKGGKLYFAIEPKPNEGHPAMLLPTVASVLLFWKKLHEDFGLSLEKKGVNKEFGHSEMIGLDLVYDTVEEIDNQAIVHMHLNSQGYNDGLILGGPGKFDIDHGVRINGFNVTIARLVQEAGYKRWLGHDMQTRPYDNVEQGIDRVVRSILSWEACARAGQELEVNQLLSYLANRQTAKAEDLMRQAVVQAQRYFDQMYD